MLGRHWSLEDIVGTSDGLMENPFGGDRGKLCGSTLADINECSAFSIRHGTGS